MFEPGTTLLGKYRIELLLGTGGMGMVVKAHHLQLDVPVAMKFLLPEALERKDVVRRFLREAQAAARLKSEHVSRIIDVGTLETGAPYMVMEYLEGNDLGVLLREQSRLDSGFAVDLMLQACEALAEAHALGIVHRDIKPSNFFITQGPDGAPFLKLLDFGVSKAPRAADEAITHSRALIGTPAYMSPEQMHSSKYVDSRADVWALGVVLYQLVSGRRPFCGETFAALIMKVTLQPMHPLDDIALPDGLAEVIARCLEKDPARRFQTTAELAIALAPYAANSMQAARSTERATRALASATLPVVSRRPRAEAANASTVGSTMSESAGEQVALSSTQSGGATTHPTVTARSRRAMLPAAVNVRPSRRRGGSVMAMVAMPVLGAALTMALVLLGRRDESGVTERDNGAAVTTAHDRVGEASFQVTAQPGSSSMDAGIASDTSVAEGRGAMDPVALAQGQPRSESTGDARVPAESAPEATRKQSASRRGQGQGRKGKGTRTVQQTDETTADPEPPDDEASEDEKAKEIR